MNSTCAVVHKCTGHTHQIPQNLAQHFEPIMLQISSPTAKTLRYQTSESTHRLPTPSPPQLQHTHSSMTSTVTMSQAICVATPWLLLATILLAPSRSHNGSRPRHRPRHLVIWQVVIPRVFLDHTLLHRHLVLTTHVPVSAPAAMSNLELWRHVFTESPGEAKLVHV